MQQRRAGRGSGIVRRVTGVEGGSRDRGGGGNKAGRCGRLSVSMVWACAWARVVCVVYVRSLVRGQAACEERPGDDIGSAGPTGGSDDERRGRALAQWPMAQSVAQLRRRMGMGSGRRGPGLQEGRRGDPGMGDGKPQQPRAAAGCCETAKPLPPPPLTLSLTSAHTAPAVSSCRPLPVPCTPRQCAWR